MQLNLYFGFLCLPSFGPLDALIFPSWYPKFVYTTLKPHYLVLSYVLDTSIQLYKIIFFDSTVNSGTKTLIPI